MTIELKGFYSEMSFTYIKKMQYSLNKQTHIFLANSKSRHTVAEKHLQMLFMLIF